MTRTSAARATILRGWTVRVLASLAAGLVLNVIVTLACAQFAPVTPVLNRQIISPDHPYFVLLDAVFVHEGTDLPTRSSEFGFAGLSTLEGFGVERVAMYTGEAKSGLFHDTLAISAGWPFKCTLARTVGGDAHRNTAHWSGGIPSPMSPRPKRLARLDEYHIWPLAPRWPGMIANTLLYAAAMYPLLATLQWVSRRLRLNAGECRRCRYLTLDLPRCPECGFAPHSGHTPSP